MFIELEGLLMDKILITGASGLLGFRLTTYLKSQGFDVITHAYKNQADTLFDLTDSVITFKALNKINPSVIINLVALTDIDRCEEHVQEAYLLNTKTVENLASWISYSGNACHLIHISTDHVYDGTGPNSESEVVITNNYALSKYAAELALGNLACTILRTNFVGRSKSEGRKSFTDWLYEAIRNQKKIKLFEDVYFSPLPISFLINMIELVIKAKPIGI